MKTPEQQVIYKYTVPLENPVEHIRMHIGAKILSVQMQKDALCIWALLPTSHPSETEDVEILIVGTGEVITFYGNNEYLGTIQYDNLVWHIFRKHYKP